MHLRSHVIPLIYFHKQSILRKKYAFKNYSEKGGIYSQNITFLFEKLQYLYLPFQMFILLLHK